MREPFGEWLEVQRVARALSKRAAARAAALAGSAWADMERGGRHKNGAWVESKPTLATLMKVAQALDLPPSEVIVAAGIIPMSGVDAVYNRRKNAELEDLKAKLEANPSLRSELLGWLTGR